MVDKAGCISYHYGGICESMVTYVCKPVFSLVNSLFSPLEIVVKSIAIFYQGRKQDTSDVALRLTHMLQQQGYEVRTIDIRDEGEEIPDLSLTGCELVIVLGGDG